MFRRTSSIVQSIFYVRSLEISDDILRTQKCYHFRNVIKTAFCSFDAILDMCRSSNRLHRFNFINSKMFSSLAFNASYKGSLTRINNSKL